MLLARQSRPWQVSKAAVWSSQSNAMITVAASNSGSQQTRSFSSNNQGSGGGGGNDGSQKIRRPQQGSQAYNKNNRAAGQQQQQQEPMLRTHMIDLFPGNYDDGDDANNSDYHEEEGDDDEEFAGMEGAMAELHRQTMEREAQKARWLENSLPPVRVPVIDKMGRSYGRGGRKAAQARVWLTPGFGNVTVNRKDLIEYFPRRSDRELVLEPLVATKTCGKFDLQCIVKSGGLTGQAGAVRLGVARALQYWNPDEYRAPLKKMGFLTRDSRKVEQKKIGLKKARKAPQWNRR